MWRCKIFIVLPSAFLLMGGIAIETTLVTAGCSNIAEVARIGSAQETGGEVLETRSITGNVTANGSNASMAKANLPGVKRIATSSDCEGGITSVRVTRTETGESETTPLEASCEFTVLQPVATELQLDLMSGDEVIATVIPTIAGARSSVWSLVDGPGQLNLGNLDRSGHVGTAVTRSDLLSLFDRDGDGYTDNLDIDVDGDNTANDRDNTPFGEDIALAVAFTCQSRGLHDTNGNAICDQFEPGFVDEAGLIPNFFRDGFAAVKSFRSESLVMVETVALTRFARTAEASNADIDPDDSIAILFNQPLDLTTLTPGSVIVLTGGTPLAAGVTTVSLTHTDDDAIVLTGPIADGQSQGCWPPGATVYIAVTVDLTSTSGFPLSYPILQEVSIAAEACDNTIDEAASQRKQLSLAGINDEDSDGDSLSDLRDNCPIAFNPRQDDADKNGIGDACDGPLPNIDGIRLEEGVVKGFTLVSTSMRGGRMVTCSATGWSDGDGDGICDAFDPCPTDNVNICGSFMGWRWLIKVVAPSTAPPAEESTLTVISKFPQDGATNLPVRTQPSATFSLPLDDRTINAQTFTLSGLSGTVTYDPLYRRAVFVPANPLALETTYTATLASSIATADGKTLGSPVSWSFGTPARITVKSNSPASGAVNVPTNTPISVTVNNGLKTSTLNAETFTLSMGVSGTLSFSEKTLTAILQPSSYLQPLTTYTASFSTAIQDTNGSTLPANHTWSFTTGRGPDVSSPRFDGVQGAVAAGANAIRVNWNNATDDLATASELVYMIYVSTDSSTFNFDNPTVTTDPGVTSKAVSGLTPNTRYYFVVRAKDTIGNYDTNSTTASATTSISTPVGCSASPLSGYSQRIALSWGAVSGACTYKIYRGTTWNFTASASTLQKTVTQTNAVDLSLDWNQTYYYRIGSVDCGGFETGSCLVSAESKYTYTLANLPYTQQGRAVHLVIDGNGGAHMTHIGSNTLYYTTNASGNWVKTTLAEGVGSWSNGLARDTSGTLHAAYWHGSTDTARYLTCSSNCSNAVNWTSTTVRDLTDNEYCNGLVALAIDRSGGRHLCYTAKTGEGCNTQYIECATCSSGCTDSANWTIATADGTAYSHEFETWRISVAADASDKTHVAYTCKNSGDGNVDVCYATNAGGSWAAEVAESDGSVGGTPSMKIDSAGRPHIAYIDGTDKELHYAVKTGGSWGIETVHAIGSGSMCALELDSNDKAHILYYSTSSSSGYDSAGYATNVNGSWHFEGFENYYNWGYYSSSYLGDIALDADGYPHFSFQRNPGYQWFGYGRRNPP